MTAVVHLSTAHSTGDTRIYHKELQTLAAQGYDCHYVVFDDGEMKTRNGVQLHPIGSRDSRLKRWRDLPQLYSKASDIDADVYHIHDWDLIPVGVALRRWTSGKVIYDVHEDYPHIIRDRDWIPDLIRPVVDSVFPRLEALASNYFDGVIAATEWVADSLHDRGVSDITTIRNFPKTQSIDIKDETTETTDSEYTLVYVGSLSEIRGLMDMIEVVAELRDRGRSVSLVCLGKFTSERFEHDARTRIRSLDVEDSIEFLGWVDYQQMFQYLSTADVGLALYELDVEHYEAGIPTKLFEYMYAGLPVIITNIQATERYVSRDWGRIVPEHETGKQADVIADLLDDPALRSEMGSAGRNAVESQFSWESEQEKLLELYEDVLSEH
jgi:glycosyltransferase involved in cell wall biosynthesis